MRSKEPTIKCPSCKSDIKLTESLAAPLIAAKEEQYRKYLNQELQKVASRESEIKLEAAALEQQRRDLRTLVEEQVAEQRTLIAAEEAKKARDLAAADIETKSSEIAVLKETVEANAERLAAAQKAQVELLREKAKLKEAQQAVELTIEERVQSATAEAKTQASVNAARAQELRDREHQEQIASMRRQIDDLKRKAEQGSQRIQGEAFEAHLEEVLRREFPRDVIEPIGKGELGADTLQRVINEAGQVVGTILWETKRTKNWVDGWLPKLRSDQRRINADVALIVSHTLPKGCEQFGFRDDIWITGPHCAVPVAIAMREMLISVHSAKKLGQGQQTKMELVYAYLTGSGFRHRIGAIVEQITEVRRDLDQERKLMTKQWAKREQQLKCLVESTAGMFGDLQGIAGQSIQEVEGLTLNLLAAPEPSNDQQAA